MTILSILLPIYEGQDFVDNRIKEINKLLNIGEEVEIIISIDKSNKLEESEIHNRLVSKINPNVKIYLQSHRLGMKNNYEYLIKKAKGKWIMLVGQDDLIVSANLNKVISDLSGDKYDKFEAILCERNYYNWNNNRKYQLMYSINLKKKKIRNITLTKILYIFGIISFIKLPMIYTGTIVRRNLLNFVETKQDGELFIFPVPDVQSATSLIFAIKKIKYITFPFTIIGTSEKSTGKKMAKIDELNISIIKKKQQIQESFLGSMESFRLNEFDNLENLIFSSHRWYSYLSILKTLNLNKQDKSIFITGKPYLYWMLGQNIQEIKFFKLLRFINLNFKSKNIGYKLIFYTSVIIGLTSYFINKIEIIIVFMVNILRDKVRLRINFNESYQDELIIEEINTYLESKISLHK